MIPLPSVHNGLYQVGTPGKNIIMECKGVWKIQKGSFVVRQSESSYMFISMLPISVSALRGVF
jgi:hypothetical protein